MDNFSRQNSVQSAMASAQVSSSQSFSSTSFASMSQASAVQQSQTFMTEIPSNFTKMSINDNGMDQMMNQFMNTNTQEGKQLIFQNKTGSFDNTSKELMFKNKFSSFDDNPAIMNQFMNSKLDGDKPIIFGNKMEAIDNDSGNQIALIKPQFSGNTNNLTRINNVSMAPLSLMDQFINAKTYQEKKKLFRNNLGARNTELYNNFFKDCTFANMSNLCVSQTRAAQISQTQVTKTVTNKVIRKRKIRKIINGEVIEEEEEIDEIENEPTTEQFVMNDARKFENIDLNVNFKDGVKIFEISDSDSPAIPEGGDNDKIKAIEGPKEKSTIKNIFGMGKKKKTEFKNIGKLEPIMDELLKTEENYVKDLLVVVEEFMPELERNDAPIELQGGNRLLLFGNIEIICMFHDVQFLTDLKECDKTPNDVASCFIKHRKEFSLYRHFNRNQPNSESYLGKYESYFKPKSQQLGVLGLRSYLIKPTQRLCRYILLMEELNKECKKHNITAKDVEETVELLKAEIRLGNDLMALDAIKDCTMDLKDQGDLIFRNQFTVQKGKEPEYTAMVFLFEKTILFTQIKLENNLDVLYFKDFLHLNDIGLTECSNDAKKFKVWFHKHTTKPYTLKTTDKDTKKKWVNEIRKQLQNELEKRKQKEPRKNIELINLIDLNEKKNKNTLDKKEEDDVKKNDKKSTKWYIE